MKTVQKSNKYKSYLKSLALKNSTIKNYAWHVDKFLLWSDKKEITKENLHKYYSLLLKKYHKASTINLRLIILNNYLRFIKYNLQFDLLSNEPNNIRNLTERQLQKFLELPLKNKQIISLRDKALLELLYATGLKVGQIIKLEKRHLDYIKNEIILDDNTHLNIKPMTWFYLDKYLQARKDNDQWLFINLDRAKKSESKQLSIRSIERIIEKYANQLNPILKVNPQIIRNTLAYKLKSQGARTQGIKQALHFQTKVGAESYWKRI